MIDTKNLNNKKNLLAFSHGVDSTALFHLLISHNIDFDFAIVHYGFRKESIKEVESAKKLSKKYHKKIHILHSDPSESNSEDNARKIRHNFFRELIKKYGYDNLITGHQLNDRMEWLLMQFTKGSGVENLIGITQCDPYCRDGVSYNIVRPLINTSRDEITNYLSQNNIKHFIDLTNEESNYSRNQFRHNYASDLVSKYSEGIKNSFKFIEEDIKRLPKLEYLNLNIDQYTHLTVFKNCNDNYILLNEVSKTLKIHHKKVLTQKQRQYIVDNNFSCQIYANIYLESVVIGDNRFSFLYSYNPSHVKNTTKKERRNLKKYNIPPKLRHILVNNLDFIECINDFFSIDNLRSLKEGEQEAISSRIL